MVVFQYVSFHQIFLDCIRVSYTLLGNPIKLDFTMYLSGEMLPLVLALLQPLGHLNPRRRHCRCSLPLYYCCSTAVGHGWILSAVWGKSEIVSIYFTLLKSLMLSNMFMLSFPLKPCLRKTTPTVDLNWVL